MAGVTCMAMEVPSGHTAGAYSQSSSTDTYALLTYVCSLNLRMRFHSQTHHLFQLVLDLPVHFRHLEEDVPWRKESGLDISNHCAYTRAKHWTPQTFCDSRQRSFWETKPDGKERRNRKV